MRIPRYLTCGAVLLAALLLASAAPVALAQLDEPEPDATETGDSSRTAKAGRLPESLARTQVRLRGTSIGKDPAARRYMDLIAGGEASPAQIAEFGSWLARRGLLAVGIEYYEAAIAREPRNADFWLNVGTIHRQMGDLTKAVSAYKKTIAIDPSNAMGHYNLGVAYDGLNRYDDAVMAYTRALTLDPTLGDPTVNPQAVLNERLLVVKMLLYQRQGGARSLPLVPTGGRLPDER